MSERTKKIFLGLCIIVPFLIYCVYYYSAMVKNAPYRFSDFESIEITYGFPDSMLNHYDSKTMQYDYLTKENALVKDTLKLRNDDLLFLHRKAQELGFWNLPDEMLGDPNTRKPGLRVPRYKLTYNYKEKSKTVTFEPDFSGPTKMVEAGQSTIDEVVRMLATARAR
ncbi:hypothetical protein [Sphingobacterium lactis]|uniref:Uncharacterized protein n=1 Tax=Sphingobacterium lactis TaxID=797291 RepID=A0A1H6CF51_9SPHI|nr:hypothetical protein [Sphingobacterium lactis]SEG71502.1 hypothetical protein SAMN05421877_11525 [Sphingobacterium lactis]